MEQLKTVCRPKEGLPASLGKPNCCYVLSVLLNVLTAGKGLTSCMDSCWTGCGTWWPGSLSSLAWSKASATSWAWNNQKPHRWRTHPTHHGPQGTLLAAHKDLAGKDSKALGPFRTSPAVSGLEGNDGEPASGAVSSGGFLKENYFDEYI